MYIGFLLSALFGIFLGVAMMLVYRPSKGIGYRSFGMWWSPILIGVAILLRGYDVGPSIAGWTLVATAIMFFLTSFYYTFFRRKKK